MRSTVQLNGKKICEDYLNGSGVEILAKEWHVGKKKIKDILKENKIEMKPRGAQQIDHNYVVSDYHIKKYNEVEGSHYIAEAKDGSVIFDDYMNEGGHLTTYIEKQYNIPTPTLYDRRKYYQTTGDYWWEQWFDIKLVENKQVKKCPYCDWTTEDIDNRSGMFMTHLLKEHNISIDQYLLEHPEDKEYFKKQSKIIEHNDKLKNKENYVICPICGEKFEKISASHIKHVHNMEYDEFRKKYPQAEVISLAMSEQTRSVQYLSNLTVSKKRFISKYELEIREYLSKFNLEFDANRQKLGGQEIDIYVPSKKIGIEFDGLYWHGEWNGKKSHDYHLNKTVKCNEQGVGLIHIFEDEYVNHKDIVYSKISQILGLNYNKEKIAGRKCVIKSIYKYEAQNFLDKYHIQGFSSSSIYLGAFYNEKLIAVMSFKNGNLKNRNLELTRFATDSDYICQGVGGKLFKHFIKNYSPEEIISFADRRWTININENLYTKLGFTISSINRPDYRYYNPDVDKFKRFHKMHLNKQKLSKKYGFPLTMTETEMAKELGYDRIWDCGLVKYVWKK